MKKHFEIPQGTNWSERVIIKNREGSVVNLSGISFANSKMKREYGNTGGFTIGITILYGGTTGTIELSTTTSTSDIKYGSYVYDVEVIGSTGAVSRILEGKIYLTPEVTT